MHIAEIINLIFGYIMQGDLSEIDMWLLNNLLQS